MYNFGREKKIQSGHGFAALVEKSNRYRYQSLLR